MKKIKFKKLLLTFIGFLVVFGFTIENPIILQVEAAVSIPQVSIVSLDHSPFIEGDKNEVFIASKNYAGKVQYQLFYTCETTMGTKWQLINNSDMSNGWTRPVDGQQPVKVDITNLKLSADYYRFAIRVRRVGVKGKYSNSYGDYDSVYPFTINVLKTKDINLNGDMLINKNDLTQVENLKIQGTSTDTSNVQYKLHLYDVRNDRWLTNLTEYKDKIEYDLSKLPTGTYIVDIWGKNKESNNKYDGWKLSIINVKNETIPKVNIVSLEHSPFVENDNNEFFISSRDYSGQVQYQLFYTCEKTMNGEWELISNEDMVDGWTKTTKTQEPVKVNLSKLNLKTEFYRFSIRVRRVGVEGKYKNVYGDYDDAYPFNVTVGVNADINLSGNILMDKTDYAKNDQLKINGVEGAAENTQFGLHLYDTVNNKWLTNLTEYSGKIDYDLSNIPEGTYILDVWGKNANSNQKYDGWKLKVIQVTSNLVKISGVEDIKLAVKRNTRYTLPQTVIVTLEDGSKVNKAVVWNKEADTRKAGAFELEGTVLGYDKKVKLTLEVEETRGNTSGNIINLGIVAENNGWIYYSNSTDNEKLYKARKDDDKITKVSDDIPLYINVIDGWIYYCNISDDGKLYKIKTDGSQRTKLANDFAEEVTVENGWIYYLSALEEYKLYKIKTDGTLRTRLNNDSSLNLNIEGDFIYYTNIDDDFKIYKIRKDGIGKTKLNNDFSGFINVIDGWIYYSNLSDNYKIYKIETNGTNRTKVSNKAGSFINVVDDYIYYIDSDNDGYLSKMKKDGTSNSKVNNHAVLYNLIDGDIYYLTEDNDYLYRTNDIGSYLDMFGIEVLEIQKKELKVIKGEHIELPKTCVATYADDFQMTQAVVWDTNEIDTSKIGEFIYEGTTKAYNGKVKLIVKVVEVSNIVDSEVKIIKGNNIMLPSIVKATLSDGTTIDKSVTWDSNQINTLEVGEYNIQGIVSGCELKAELKVKVLEIISVAQQTFEKSVPKGYKVTLPSTINATTSEGVIDSFSIKWGSMPSTQSTGDYTYEGTITGYDGKIEFKLNVYESENAPTGRIVARTGGWIYYHNIYDVGSIYRIKEDGTSKMKIIDNYVESTYRKTPIYSDGWLYYYGRSKDGKFYGFFRIKDDGTEEGLLDGIGTDTGMPAEMVVDSGWIYILKTNQLIKMKLDGTNKTEIKDSEVSGYDENNLQISGDFMYFYSQSGRIYKMKKDGTNSQILSSNNVRNMLVLDNNIYYCSYPEGKIKRKNISTGQEVTYNNTNIDYIMYVVGNYIYYHGNDEYIYRVGLDGTSNIKIINDKVKEFYIYEDLIYYKNLNDNWLYQMKLDGSGNQIIG
jgi:hypothetical protein